MTEYTTEQLQNIAKNLALVNSRAASILTVLEENKGIKHGQIFTEANLSKFVTDKIITAFLVCGFIEKDIDGQNLSYVLTQNGRNFLKLEIERGNR
ncbi:winged helix-turn-helix domain-containing protein [Clostridium hydrogeniformans]|uniref:winged helix-turn-helix domain-containing protein n=1 Tax=Clostridium hydrogeniformans TaxID=349933 RepID=UPI00048A0B3E|nr:winged helix-turn-helix domain-containing protein [Clostridium hydrogeniformans]